MAYSRAHVSRLLQGARPDAAAAHRTRPSQHDEAAIAALAGRTVAAAQKKVPANRWRVVFIDESGFYLLPSLAPHLRSRWPPPQPTHVRPLWSPSRSWRRHHGRPIPWPACGTAPCAARSAWRSGTPCAATSARRQAAGHLGRRAHPPPQGHACVSPQPGGRALRLRAAARRVLPSLACDVNPTSSRQPLPTQSSTWGNSYFMQRSVTRRVKKNTT